MNPLHYASSIDANASESSQIRFNAGATPWYEKLYFRVFEVLLILGLIVALIVVSAMKENGNSTVVYQTSINSAMPTAMPTAPTAVPIVSPNSIPTPGPTETDYDLVNHICPIPDRDWTPASYVNTTKFYQRCVNIPYLGKSLSGALTVPFGGGPYPLLVMLGGSGATDMDSDFGDVPNKFMKDIAW